LLSFVGSRFLINKRNNDHEHRQARVGVLLKPVTVVSSIGTGIEIEFSTLVAIEDLGTVSFALQ